MLCEVEVLCEDNNIMQQYLTGRMFSLINNITNYVIICVRATVIYLMLTKEQSGLILLVCVWLLHK